MGVEHVLNKALDGNKVSLPEQCDTGRQEILRKETLLKIWFWKSKRRKGRLGEKIPSLPVRAEPETHNTALPTIDQPVLKTSLPQQHNPCEKCGACCAFFQVSFLSSETDNLNGDIPLDLTSPFSATTRIMKGTEKRQFRCVALEGVVGLHVRCTIYENRPSSCRSFARSWEDDNGNAMCDKARTFYGLEPFSRF